MNQVSSRSGKIKFDKLIGYGASALTAGLIIMWSVTNIWLNILMYRQETDPDKSWMISAVIVLLTCVVPFGFGLVMLVKSLNRLSPTPARGKGA